MSLGPLLKGHIRCPGEALFIESFKAGDAKAFEWVYKDLKTPLTQSALVMVNSVADAEDITSNAFLKLYSQGRKEVTSLEHIRRWMWVIIRHESINFLRQRSKEKRAYVWLANHLAPGVDGRFDEDPDLAAVHAISKLKALPGRPHTILRLYFFEELTTRQIAEKLRISRQTVLNHKARGIHFLRRQLVIAADF